ncbi:hypothetical protein SOCEGT47_076190 [Sorangium cellulosum]|nr:hypothetical protein SOCEGT47_076190 [Sorangium cellulosum]
MPSGVLGYHAAMNTAPRQNLLRWITGTRAPAPTVLIRLAVGSVFLSEGIQKFLFAAERGAGRFARIGLPAPDVLGPLVGATEILCGSLVLLGLATRLAAMPLIATMLVAITTTKIPILVQRGFWAMAHDSRTDWSMLLGALFLLIVGAGPLALDARIAPPEGPRSPR